MTAIWQLVVSGAAGSSLTYAFTYLRERKRMQDAYRAPQRQAIAEILTAGHEFQLSALNWRRVQADLIAEIRQSRTENLPAIRAEIHQRESAYAAAMMEMRRAIEVGSLTVVDVPCWKEMVVAAAAFEQFNDDPDGTREFSSVDEIEQCVELNKERSHQLRVAVSALVKTANGRVTPVESRRTRRQRRNAQRQLTEHLRSEPSQTTPDGGPDA